METVKAKGAAITETCFYCGEQKVKSNEPGEGNICPDRCGWGLSPAARVALMIEKNILVRQ